MKRALTGVCVAVALTAVAAAQDMKMDHPMAMEKTYSGCVERGKTGSFTLTHSTIAGPAASMTTHDDHMMNTEEPAPIALSAANTNVNLGKYRGRKVTVTGTDGDTMGGMATLKVTSIKPIVGSCS